MKAEIIDIESGDALVESVLERLAAAEADGEGLTLGLDQESALILAGLIELGAAPGAHVAPPAIRNAVRGQRDVWIGIRSDRIPEIGQLLRTGRDRHRAGLQSPAQLRCLH